MAVAGEPAPPAVHLHHTAPNIHGNVDEFTLRVSASHKHVEMFQMMSVFLREKLFSCFLLLLFTHTDVYIHTFSLTPLPLLLLLLLLSAVGPETSVAAVLMTLRR